MHDKQDGVGCTAGLAFILERVPNRVGDGGWGGPKPLWGRLLIRGGLLIRLGDAAASHRTLAALPVRSDRRIANPPQVNNLVNNLPHKGPVIRRSPKNG